jgi:hypothetical protein
MKPALGYDGFLGPLNDLSLGMAPCSGIPVHSYRESRELDPRRVATDTSSSSPRPARSIFCARIYDITFRSWPGDRLTDGDCVRHFVDAMLQITESSAVTDVRTHAWKTLRSLHLIHSHTDSCRLWFHAYGDAVLDVAREGEHCLRSTPSHLHICKCSLAHTTQCYAGGDKQLRVLDLRSRRALSFSRTTPP